MLAVVTNPDRPRGRGRLLAPPPVKEAACELGLPVLQPDGLDEPELAQRLADGGAELFAVVAFSILPPSLLAVPPRGAVNLHPSLLPAYRGAAPIPWAVIRGERETGITTFLLDRRVDAGAILLQRREPIHPEETAGELGTRLQELGAALLVETVDGLEQGRLQSQPQERAQASRAPKLSREDGRIDWGRTTDEVRNLIRGTNPVPGAYTEWGQAVLKVHRSRPAEAGPGGSPGTVLGADPRAGLLVATGDGALLLTEVQPAGKPRMDGGAFVRGHHIPAGTCLGRPGA